MQNQYSGTTAETLIKLNEEKPNSSEIGNLLRTAILANHDNMLSALQEYKKTNEKAVDDSFYILRQFSFEETKQHLDLLLKYINLNDFLYQLIRNIGVTSAQGVDAQKLKIQGEIIEILADKGAILLTNNDYDLVPMDDSIYKLQAYKDIFLDKKITSADRYLNLVSYARIQSWNETTMNYVVDAEKVRIQVELIKFALEKGANINSYVEQNTPYWNLKFIVAAKDALLNSGEKSLTTNNFLKIVLNALANDDNEINQKAKLLKFALEKGADINSYLQQYTPSWNLKFIEAAKDALLNSGEKSLTANNFLKIVLNASANDSELAQKIELIKSALEKGADINSSVQQNTPYWNLKFIEAAKDALLNSGEKSLTANNFLKIVLNASANDSELAQKIELIKFALEKGADINELDYISFENIIAHRDLFLDDPKNPLKADKLLKLALKANVTTYDSVTQKEVVDLEKVKIQGMLITVALDKGAKLAEEDLEGLGLTAFLTGLFYNKELLFEHHTNPIGEFLLQIVLKSLNSRFYDGSGALVIDHEKNHQRNEIIKYAIEQGADLNGFVA